jgi:hypothetical protein
MAPLKNAFPLAAILVSLTLTHAHAQRDATAPRGANETLAALNRFESFSPADAFATASPGDPDLGEQLLLTPGRRYRPFSIGAGYQTTWTSNAFYTPSSPVSDVMMSAYADALALPHIGGNVFLEGAAAIRGYRYFRNPTLDFNSLDVSAGVLKVFRELADVGLYGRYQFTYLFGRTGDILNEHSLATGVRKTFQFSRANALFVSAEASFSLGGQPAYAMSHEFNVFAAHQLSWTRAFSTSLFYQMTVFDFTRNSRADLRNYIGLSADVRPLKWLTLSANSWLGWNASNEADYNFFVANLGGGITASINF